MVRSTHTSTHASAPIHTSTPASASSPLVSVIIPSFNTATSTIKLVHTLLQDAYSNLEIIVVIDGSTDDTFTQLQTISDPRLTTIYQSNSGQSAARNAGIALAHGQYLIFLDSDDSISPTFITDLVQSIMQPHTTLAVCGFKRLRPHLPPENLYLSPRRAQLPHETFTDYILWLLLKDGRMYSSVNKIYHTSIIQKHHLSFDVHRNFAEDTKFVLDYLRYTPGPINFILKPLYTYHFGETTSTIKTSATKWSNWQRQYQDLKSWVQHTSKQPRLTLRTRTLLHLIRLRWRISYLRSIKRARASH